MLSISAEFRFCSISWELVREKEAAYKVLAVLLKIADDKDMTIKKINN